MERSDCDEAPAPPAKRARLTSSIHRANEPSRVRVHTLSETLVNQWSSSAERAVLTPAEPRACLPGLPSPGSASPDRPSQLRGPRPVLSSPQAK